MRTLLKPILKLFFNPNPLIQALHIQSELNTRTRGGGSRRRCTTRSSTTLCSRRRGWHRGEEPEDASGIDVQPAGFRRAARARARGRRAVPARRVPPLQPPSGAGDDAARRRSGTGRSGGHGAAGSAAAAAARVGARRIRRAEWRGRANGRPGARASAELATRRRAAHVATPDSAGRRRSPSHRIVKLAVVVQRYGADINGGAELHARYIAERLSRHAEVEVVTTCARDYVTWRNELPAGCRSGQRHLRSAAFPFGTSANPTTSAGVRDVSSTSRTRSPTSSPGSRARGPRARR